MSKTALELLAPARNVQTGIAAIDCGADAVYIAGPDFGARKAAGNSFEDIGELCAYAHRFGAKVFVTFNTIIYDEEIESAHSQMLRAQECGADAFIIRDERICGWEDIVVPLHASTQCAIRDIQRARHFEALGCSRIILERELSLQQVKEISAAVSCEVEFFVHGALCVGYSGECRLSQYLDGRSADRGECIQACRSLYDLVDSEGKVLVRNKALLSLKDYNLKNRLEDLAQAGVISFKIEGRLKNPSYVKNITRDYSLALDALCQKDPERWCRASYGTVKGGFEPDSAKTFNRGYTELWIDGRRGRWSSMDAPKSMGEFIGTIRSIRPRPEGKGNYDMEIAIDPANRSVVLHNGDGFAFSTRDGVTGFRGDVCEGLRIFCKTVPDIYKGARLFRNINSNFEKLLETQQCHREISVSLDVRIYKEYMIDIKATTEDGRTVVSSFNADVDTAENRDRAEAMLRDNLNKRSGHLNFRLDNLEIGTPGKSMPLLSASTINSMRRLVADDIGREPFGSGQTVKTPRGGTAPEVSRLHLTTEPESKSLPLLRSKYCIRYELGMCPVHQNAPQSGPLFLINSGRKLELHFDCGKCEMSVTQAQK